MFLTLWTRLSYFLKDFSLYLILLFLSLTVTSFALFKIYKSQRQTKQKKLLIAASALILFSVLIFVACEAYFRYVYDVPDGLGFLKVSQKWTERHVVHNNYFYRDRDFETAKKEGVIRIGVLGDSITWGGGIENPQDRFSNILEQQSREAGYNVEVYNLGRPGYDSQQEIEEFEKVRHLNFDILIWEYFINDIQPSARSTGSRIIVTNRDLPATISFFTQKSYFLDYLYWKLSPKYRETFLELRTADNAQYSNGEVLADHEERISNFIKSFEGTKTKILVVIFPSLLLLGEDYQALQIHEIMTQIFKNNNLEVIDLLSDFINLDREKLMASKFDPHPNEFVHRKAAEKLFVKMNHLLKNHFLKNN